MKYPFYISLLLCGLLWMAACTGPIILDDPASPETETGKDEGPHTRDSVPIVHEGTYTSPYSIGEALTLGRGKSVWIEGYIVGCVQSNSIKSGCDFTADAPKASNILLADTFPTGSEYDYLYCIAIQLPNGSVERSDLNLYDNPDNYHCKLRIKGDLTQYISTPGMKEITGYAFTDEISYEPDDEDNDNENEEDNEDPKEPDLPHDPNATRQDTLSIAEGIKLQSETEYNQVYIRGYIVGYYNNSYIRFSPSIEEINNLARNNIVLADDINERDEHNVIIVDLPINTALREQVNLKDNPQNLNRILTVKGKMEAFRKTDYHGCMETLSKYQDDEDYYFSIE
ncbi:MAG: hypothetical protein IKJ18_01970 [Bacteroidaceae bacterium]|nr:hypothetical protein [Bacteroidaceae bacterium]